MLKNSDISLLAMLGHLRSLLDSSSCQGHEGKTSEKSQIIDLVSENGEIFKIEHQSQMTPRKRLISCIDTQVRL